ncbi:MAG: hypothetical protein LAO21_22590 [Acidobacteriia bacterium]|nr:hypothetical protein [Terriglobia bacterium]
MNMRLLQDFQIIAAKEYKELGRKSTTMVTMALLLMGGIFNFIVVARSLQFLPGVTTLIVDLLFTHYALSMNMFVVFMLINNIFMKEKYTKTLETLLTTPLSARTIWLGKSSFVFIVAILFSYVSCVVGFIAFTLSSKASPDIVWPSAQAVFFALVVLPLSSIAIVCLLSAINLILWNAAICNAVFFLGGVAYLGGSSARIRQLRLTWTSDFVQLSIATSLIALAWLLSHLLTNERIVVGRS